MNIDGNGDESVKIEVDTSDGVKQVNALNRAYDALTAQLNKLMAAGAGLSGKMGTGFNNMASALNNAANAGLKFGQNFATAAQQTATLANAAGTVGGAIGNLASGLTNFGRNLNNHTNGLHSFFNVLKDVRGGMWALIDVVKLLTEPFLILAGIIGGVGAKIIDTLNVLQGFKATMSILTTNSAEVGQSWDFLKNIANTLGVELTSLTSSYGKLMAAIPDGNNKMATAQNIFLGVASAARTLHASNHDTQLMFYAITQMASKARISMEELNRQLGEKVPGMMKLMADKLKTTPDLLMDAIRKGTVDSIKFLEQMGPAMWEKFFGSAQVAAQSVDASINRLKNLWVETIKYMDDNGIGPEIANLFDTIRDKLSDPSVGKAFYETVKDITDQLTNFVKGLKASDVKEGFNTFFELIKGGTEIMMDLGRAAVWAITKIREAKAYAEESPSFIGRLGRGLTYMVDPTNMYGMRPTNISDDQKKQAGQLVEGRVISDPRADWRKMENQYQPLKPTPVKETTLEGVLAPSNKKGKKGSTALSEGERYIEMLEKMQDRTEKLTEVEKIESAVAEGRLKFDSPAQAAKAKGLAMEIDFAKAVEKGNKELEKRNQHQTELNNKYNEYLQSLKDGVADLEQEYALLGLTSHEQEMLKFQLDGQQKIRKQIRDLQKDAKKYGLDFDAIAKEKELNDELQKQLDLREKLYQAQRTASYGITDWFNQLNDAATNSAQIIQDALQGAFDASASAIEGFLNTGRLDFKKWTQDITRMVNNMVSKEITTSLFNMMNPNGKGATQGGGLLTTLFNLGMSAWGASSGAGMGLAASGFSSNIAASGALASTAGPMSNSFYAMFAGASAKGNAFNGGNPIRFARGGIVNRATGFGMSNGRWGVMGEAGPEGILPLARDAQGRLGVRGGGNSPTIMYIQTPDANSFRKSRTQIMNQYSLAIARQRARS